ncbi:MAG: CHAT domain-containing tetratricopeptide repeat protein [Bacteroidota bacterium]
MLISTRSQKTILLTTFFVISLFHFCNAQIQTDQQALVLEDSALVIEQSKPGNALSLYNDLSDYYFSKGNFDKYVFVILKSSGVYQRLGDYETMGSVLDSANQLIDQLELSSDVNEGRLYYFYSILKTRLYDNDSAVYYGEKALDILSGNRAIEKREEAVIHSQMGNAYISLGLYRKAIEKYLSAIELKTAGVGNNPNVVSEYANLAVCYLYLLDYDLAKKYAFQSLEMKKKYLKENHLSTAYGYNLAGVLLNYLQDHQQSIKNHHKAKRIYENILGLESRKALDQHRHISSNFTNQGNYDSALWHMQYIRNIYAKIYANDLRSAARQYSELANIHILKYADSPSEISADLSMRYLDSLAAYFDHTTSDIALQGDYYIMKSKILRHLGAYEKALLSCQKGLSIVSPGLPEKDFSRNPVADSIADLQNVAIWLLEQKIDCLIDFSTHGGRNDELDLLIDKAFQSFDLLVENILVSSFSGEENVSFLEEFMGPYNSYIKFLISDPGREKDKKLLESIQKIKAKTFRFYTRLKKWKGDKKKGEQELKALLEQLESVYQKELESTKDQSRVQSLKDSIFAVKHQLIRLEKNLSKKFISEEKLMSAKENQLIDQSQLRELSKGQAVIEYTVAGDEMIVVKIEEGKVMTFSIVYDQQLIDDVSNLESFLASDQVEAYKQSAYRLYEKLLKPLPINTSNLLIIPDGVLWRLNFEILLKEMPDHTDFRTMDYLLNSYSISYHQSISLIDRDRTPTETGNERLCLAFSYNPDEVADKQKSLDFDVFRSLDLASLPGTSTEIKAIAGLIDGKYFFGSDASETNFKKFAPNYGILHLAIHGEFNSENPLKSRLLFQLDQGEDDDNALHASELYNMSLNADMVVLSACESGVGKSVNREGVLGLSRAFNLAGAKSVINSLWELSDVVAPSLMQSFYQNLKSGQTKSEALRRAKLSYLSGADKPSANPYYWGAMVHFGDDSPLFHENKSNKGFLIFSIALLISVFTLFFFFTKKSA